MDILRICNNAFHWNYYLCTFQIIFIELFGYKKVGFTRCNETFCTEAHIGDTLQQIRKGCDDNSWCTMIYQSHCKLDGTTTKTSVFMCSVEAPTLHENNWESCLWEKGKFKILMFGLIND